MEENPNNLPWVISSVIKLCIFYGLVSPRPHLEGEVDGLAAICSWCMLKHWYSLCYTNSSPDILTQRKNCLTVLQVSESKRFRGSKGSKRQQLLSFFGQVQLWVMGVSLLVLLSSEISSFHCHAGLVYWKGAGVCKCQLAVILLLYFLSQRVCEMGKKHEGRKRERGVH